MMTSEEEESGSAPLNHVFLPVGQNFVSVLNDPMEEEESWWWPSSDTWDYTTPVESTYTPVYTSPDPDVSDSLAFFESIARNTVTPPSSPRNTPDGPGKDGATERKKGSSDNAGGEEGELLETVPRVFFTSELRLTDPHIFESVLPQRQIQHTGMLLHERLTHFLDIVEVALLRRVADRSDQVFTAVEQYQRLFTAITHCLSRVALLRRRLHDVQQHAVGNPLQITRLRTAKSNMLALQHRLDAIRELSSTPSSVDLLLATGKHEAALEMIHQRLDALEEGHYGDDVWELSCVRDVVQRLQEQQTEVCIGIAEMVVAVTARTFLEALPEATHPPELLASLRPHGDHLPDTTAAVATRIASIAAYNTYLAAFRSSTDAEGIREDSHHVTPSNISNGSLLFDVEDVPANWDSTTADPITCPPEHLPLILHYATQQGKMLIQAAATLDIRLADATDRSPGPVLREARGAVEDMLVRICDWCRPGGDTHGGSWHVSEISRVVSLVLAYYEWLRQENSLPTRSGPLERAVAEWIREKLKDEYSRITESLPKIIRQDPWTRERVPECVQNVLDALREGNIGHITAHNNDENDSDTENMANGIRLGPADEDSPLCPITFSGIRLVLIVQGLLPLIQPYVSVSREILERSVLAPVIREIFQTFLHLLKNFNSNIYQMILGGGLYNLRQTKIRTDSVAITVQIVDLEMFLEEQLRDIFESILSENQRVFLEEMDTFEEEMQGHRNNLLSKMCSISRAATDASINKYNWSNLSAPSPIASLGSSLSKLYGPIREYLSEKDARHVFQNSASLSVDRLSDAINNLSPSPRAYQFMRGEVRELRRRMRRFRHLHEPDFSSLESAVGRLQS
eukprot:gb/GECH01002488.1/.p1 GENE.gb/GECH01002488.1/~~gb/GECH01002488.1/.p1  ORF type:complete len:857 (+),score=156.59 gb/GECH01002488.1/:1-2571(+)